MGFGLLIYTVKHVVLLFGMLADLFTNCMLPAALSRDRRPCVRSISWSPIGMAPNYGYEFKGFGHMMRCYDNVHRLCSS
jgi:hypothetical protein